MATEKLLRLLNENEVKYVIIGATAFPIYGYVRATLDIDIFIEPTPENAQKTFAALQEFGYDMEEVTIPDLLQTKVLIRQYSLETDIHPFVAGVTFDEVWRNKIAKEYGNVKTHFASLEDLIKMKKAANRPKDKEDLKYLERIKKKTQNN